MILYILTTQKNGAQHIEYASTNYMDTIDKLHELKMNDNTVSRYTVGIDTDEIPSHREAACIMTVIERKDI